MINLESHEGGGEICHKITALRVPKSTVKIKRSELFDHGRLFSTQEYTIEVEMLSITSLDSLRKPA